MNDKIGVTVIDRMLDYLTRKKSGREFSDFKEIILSVEGQTTHDECQLLFKLAQNVHKGCIVEVGSYRGRSSIALAFGAMVSGREIPVYAIDPQESFQGVLGGSFGPEDRRAFYQNMLKSGAWQVVRLVNLSSEIVASGWREPVALLWIDGDHRYEGVKRDFEEWQPHLTTGARVVFHDATDSEGGPYRLISEILAAGGYEETSGVGLIRILQRKENRQQ